MSNDDDKKFILEQQSKRFAVLKFIWEETRTRPKNHLFNFAILEDIADNASIYSDVELFEILQYLQSEGLIELIQHMGQRFPVSRITHQGKIEIEAAITKPHQRTEDFVEPVIMIFYGQVGAVQTGENTATVSQKNK
jgi:hypothetical protein